MPYARHGSVLRPGSGRSHAKQEPENSAYTVAERGPNSRVWQRVVWQTNALIAPGYWMRNLRGMAQSLRFKGIRQESK